MTTHARPDDYDPAFQSDNDYSSPHIGSQDMGDSGESLGFGAGIAGEEAAPKKGSGAKKKAKRKPARKKKASSSSSEKKDEEQADGGDAPPKKKTRRRRSKKKAASESSEAEAEEAEKPAKKKASKKKKATRKKAAAKDAEQEGGSDEDSEGSEKKRRRRRGSRGGRRRRKKSATEDGVEVDGIPGDEGDLPDLPDDTELVAEGDEGGKKKRRRRRSRKKNTDDEADEEEAESKGSKKKGKKKKAKKKASKKSKKDAEKTEEELEAEAEAARVRQILVNAVDPEEKRVAVVEGERIHDLLMTSDSQKSLVNDIYRGRVVNLEPAIGAAFVDFGQGRNGFLHTSDVLAIYGEKDFTLDQLLTSKVDPEEWDDAPAQPNVGDEVDDEEDDDSKDSKESKSKEKASKKKGKKKSTRRRSRDRRPISELLKVGDQVVVQITKDAIGDKGPTLTTYISIPGRYLVLMPSMARTGVSRKIPDDKERRRLKRILSSIDTPDDMGVIVRTAGVGKTKKDLARDLNYLLGVWQSFGKRLTKGRGPTALYQESNVAIRTLRDLFGPTTKEVVVDDPVVHEELTEFATKLMPEHTDRIRLHEAERPLFHHHGIEQDFEKVFTRRVELPSGGSIVFDQAEALVAIDVNSGRTRTNSFDFEEIALKTNLEAVPEIARQIRLRDLGGILVCDFIDMMKSSSNRTVERALRNALADDRARSKMGRISQFGLLEMTRQRLGPGTHKKVFQACPRCRGTGRVRTVQSRAQAILRRLGSALTQKGFTTVEARAHPEVVDYLHDHLWDYVRALEHRFEKEVKTTSVPDQPEDSVLRYLRADGREVRPGGRRKR